VSGMYVNFYHFGGQFILVGSHMVDFSFMRLDGDGLTTYKVHSISHS
jgi:hypothetical protein